MLGDEMWVNQVTYFPRRKS